MESIVPDKQIDNNEHPLLKIGGNILREEKRRKKTRMIVQYFF